MTKTKNTPTFWATVGVLFIFWILITGRLHWQHLLVGALCSYGITAFNRDLLLDPSERPLYHRNTLVKWISYFTILVIAVFKSNIDVAKIVLRPKLDISPGFVRFRTKVEKPVNRVILANSITLTPGTLSVEMEDDYYVVHAITRGHAEDVATWDMMDKLTEIEEAEKHGA
jgi:multicomponent Na+:H+ antiporter subunit E